MRSLINNVSYAIYYTIYMYHLFLDWINQIGYINVDDVNESAGIILFT